MTAPMTLEQAVEEARKRGLGPGWIAQDGPCGWPWRWLWHPRKPISRDWGAWGSPDPFVILGTGAPNPDGWRETLTEITNIRRDANA